MRWLVPDRSFVLIYKDRAPGDTRPAKLERIGFLCARDGSRASAPEPGSAAARADSAPSRGPGALTGASGQPDRRPRTAIARTGSDTLRDRASGKPETPHTPKSEIKSVAEQLSAATPAAQMAIERDARAPDRQGPPPEFLRPHGDVAQTTLQQQMQRSQALAVEQLRALREAYKAACQAKGTGPC